MARLTIPRAEYAVLDRIASLSDDDLNMLATALKESESKIVDLDLSKIIGKSLKSFPSNDIKSFTRTLAAIFAIKEFRNREVEDILSDVKETIDSEKPANFDAVKLPKLLEHLRKLLNMGGGINVIAKAKSVLLSHERVYCGSRILSDIRPIFFLTPDEISAAAVVHTLSISYHQDGDHKHFHVALNPTDLEDLKQTIERAERKAKAVRAHVEKSGIRYLEDTE